MVKDRPGKVTDPDRRTKVFDWKVPVRVGGRPAAIAGDLFWVPKPGGSFPLAAGIALAPLVLGGAALVLVVRRRRGRRGPVRGGLVKRRPLVLSVVVAGAGRAGTAPAHATVESTSPVPGRGARQGSARAGWCSASARTWRRTSARCACSTPRGRRVDRGATTQPTASSAAVSCEPGLPDGAVHRHLPRRLGRLASGLGRLHVHRRAAPAAARRRRSTALIDDDGAGPVTSTAFARGQGRPTPPRRSWSGARFSSGWRGCRAAPGPARRRAGGRATRPRPAPAGLRRRLATAAAGIVLQGATAGGTSFWSALDPAVIHDVLATGFGSAWARAAGGLRRAAGGAGRPRRPCAHGGGGGRDRPGAGRPGCHPGAFGPRQRHRPACR